MACTKRIESVVKPPPLVAVSTISYKPGAGDAAGGGDGTASSGPIDS